MGSGTEEKAAGSAVRAASSMENGRRDVPNVLSKFVECTRAVNP
jgi:hypothetical protein